MRSAEGEFEKVSVFRIARKLIPSLKGLIWASLCGVLVGVPMRAVAQWQHPTTVQAEESGPPFVQGTTKFDSEPLSDSQMFGYISGTVMDRAGAVAVNAQVRLTREDQFPIEETLSGDTGGFSFTHLPAGSFQLTITAPGFETARLSGALRPGEAYIVPVIRLAVATVVTEVRVGVTPVDVAHDQVKEQEQQRVFGFVPNFYVSYIADAAPLAPKQKFELAWKSTMDPFTFVGVGVLAGVQQATNAFEGYGQGAQGYGNRYGAAYGNVVAGTFIGSAILPSLLKQDPRYFYKGTGTTHSRILYALGNTVFCKGDNKRWQPNYSGVFGSFATGSISYFYYPANDRDAGKLILQNSLIRIGETAFANILQEFLLRRVTPRLHSRAPVQP